jgi:hypothetical protein
MGTDLDRDAAGWGWLALAVVAAGSVAAHLVATGVVVVAGPRDMSLVMLPGWALASWWGHRGAWLRTRWGRPAPGTPAPWQEPALTTTRLTAYTWLGGACVVAVALALAWQARAWVR